MKLEPGQRKKKCHGLWRCDLSQADMFSGSLDWPAFLSSSRLGLAWNGFILYNAEIRNDVSDRVIFLFTSQKHFLNQPLGGAVSTSILNVDTRFCFEECESSTCMCKEIAKIPA